MKTVRAALILWILWVAAAAAQSVPDDTRLIPTAIPDTSLIIDVPVNWEPLPEELNMGGTMFSFFDGEGTAEEELAAFGNFTTDGGAFMLISRGDGFMWSPLQEVQTIAQGIRLSRALTWIIGSGMQITVPPQDLRLGAGIEAATLSFLSGQKGDNDVLSMTVLRLDDEDTILIVDIAPRGSTSVQTLDAMRRSIRRQ